MKKLCAALVSIMALLVLITSARAVQDVPRIWGDSNGDGRLTNLDLIITCQYMDGTADWIHFGETDINGDGSITPEDVLLAANCKLSGRPPEQVTVEAEYDAVFEDGADGLRFFARSPDHDAEELVLYSAETGERLASLRDDGLSDESGDALPKDGIFTGTIDPKGAFGDSLTFYAGGAESARSVNITVAVREPLLADGMAAVDETIRQNVFGVKNYDKLKPEKRFETVKTVIDGLCGDGLIRQDSVYYNSETWTATFRYKSGVMGAVMVGPFGNDKNGALTAPVTSYASKSTETKPVPYLGRALILWSFGQKWDNSARKTYYSTLKKNWDAKGLVTTLNTSPTAADYRHLEGYDLIVFAGHGSAELFRTDDGGLVEYPMVLLTEGASAEKDRLYAFDLADGNICRVSVSGGTKYAVLPSYFTGEMGGAVVISESCGFFGNVTGDTKMAQSLEDCGASAVLGYQGTATAAYSRNVLNDLTLALLSGKSVEDALTAAEGKHKKTLGGGSLTTLHTAGEAVFGTEYREYLSNGGFEADTPTDNWLASGVMTAARIGDMRPPEGGAMAALTAGTSISQTLKIPSGARRLAFFYDVCNARNRQQTGSKEVLTVDAVTPKGTTNLLKTTTAGTPLFSIDNAAPTPVYHGGWEWCELDVSKLAGQTVTLTFAVSDEAGAVTGNFILLDDITLSTNMVKGATANEMLAIARTQLDTTEWPFESNNVKYNTAYYGKEVFSEDGETYAWCCAFQWWLFREANASELFYGGKKTASCRAAVDYAQKNRQWVSDITAFYPGDIVFYNYNSEPTADHVGIFLRYDDNGDAVCIEGNTSLTDDDNGGRVMVRHRSGDVIMGAYRPKYYDDGIVYDGR